MNRYDILPPQDLHLTVSYENGFEQWEVPPKAPTQYMAHGYFRYIGKFPPQIADKLIADYGVSGGILVDPMCGSGTTLIEAARREMNAIGFDINPVALLISRVCTRPVESSLLREAYKECENLLSDLDLMDTPMISRMSSHRIGKESSTRDLFGMEHYFDKVAFTALLGIQAWIDDRSDFAIRDFFQLALLSILRHVSRANVKKMNTEIDENKRILAVVPTFRTQVKEMMEVNDTLVMQNFPPTVIEIREGEAERTNISSDTTQLVVLHPPYLSGTAFSESVQLQLAWMQFNHKNLRSKELAMRGSYFHKPDGLRKYLVGWNSILVEAYRILEPGGHCAVVIGDGSVDSVRIPMGPLTAEFGQDIGYAVVKQARHLLNHNTGRTLNKKMKFQEVIVLRK